MKLLIEMKKYSLLLILVLISFTSCKNEVKKENLAIVETSRVAHLPYYDEESFTPKWITPGTSEEKDFHKIPDFELTNQLGEIVNQKTFENKIYVTDFFFTICPGICPQMTDHMHQIQEEFKNDDDVLLLSHSVMPSTDSVSVLREYANTHEVIDDKWHLVTGEKTEIYSLGRDQYFVENDMGVPKDLNDFLHTENFLLIDKNKHIRGIYNGLNRASIAQLITDIKALKLE
ncbi:SCO family protein [Ulvibacter antarcticus]|uniref:Protein SCO1/2 n=1 Tax=Ulvibacter antarcticus TaxID=442714 RepID=A0A3L9Z352_9FLAO|nr:SCO family protein [Ulvibacter antarcticus]RMA64768.1 protein SCO1/2 [Ulvibacter antarcticus]